MNNTLLLILGVSLLMILICCIQRTAEQFNDKMGQIAPVKTDTDSKEVIYTEPVYKNVITTTLDENEGPLAPKDRTVDVDVYIPTKSDYADTSLIDSISIDSTDGFPFIITADTSLNINTQKKDVAFANKASLGGVRKKVVFKNSDAEIPSSSIQDGTISTGGAVMLNGTSLVSRKNIVIRNPEATTGGKEIRIKLNPSPTLNTDAVCNLKDEISYSDKIIEEIEIDGSTVKTANVKTACEKLDYMYNGRDSAGVYDTQPTINVGTLNVYGKIDGSESTSSNIVAGSHETQYYLNVTGGHAKLGPDNKRWSMTTNIPSKPGLVFQKEGAATPALQFNIVNPDTATTIEKGSVKIDDYELNTDKFSILEGTREFFLKKRDASALINQSLTDDSNGGAQYKFKVDEANQAVKLLGAAGANLLVHKGNNPVTTKTKLQKGEGDCDKIECAKGLSCLQRVGREAVPGFSAGGPGDKSGHDYCYDPKDVNCAPCTCQWNGYNYYNCAAWPGVHRGYGPFKCHKSGSSYSYISWGTC